MDVKKLLGDALPAENALLITGAVLVAMVLVEVGLFQQCWQDGLRALGLGCRAGVQSALRC